MLAILLWWSTCVSLPGAALISGSTSPTGETKSPPFFSWAQRILTCFTQNYIFLLPKLHIYPLLKVELFFTVFLSYWKLYKFRIEKFWYISCESNSHKVHPGLFIYIDTSAFHIKLFPPKNVAAGEKCASAFVASISYYRPNLDYLLILISYIIFGRTFYWHANGFTIIFLPDTW